MKKIRAAAAALILSTCFASATTIKWTQGWDNFGVQLNYKKSTVAYTPATGKLKVSVKLVGGMPNNLYQVALNFFCTSFPATFGQFPVEEHADGTCISISRQGVAASIAEVELGVVLTDMNGNGTFSVVIAGVTPGTYNVEFFVRNGVGCDYIGGAPCEPPYSPADYQSPGPTFGDAATITVP